MIRKRSAKDRGGADFGWLKSHHTFSFGSYYDPKHIHFKSLRVINEDFIAPLTGFDTHPHDNMEIITYVISGEVSHKDTMGNQTVIKAGRIQVMSAGTGIMHSEHNRHRSETLHLYQIWILPNQKNVRPHYQELSVPNTENEWVLLVSSNGKSDSLTIHQNAMLWTFKSTEDATLSFPESEHTAFWVQVVKGKISLNGETGQTGDGFSVEAEERPMIFIEKDSELLLFGL